MPAEVIATIHQFAIASKKYKGIVFTDKHGNTIDEDNEVGPGDNVDADDVTGVGEYNGENHSADINTGDKNDEEPEPINHDITGVAHDVINEEPTIQVVTGVTHDFIKSTGIDEIGNTGVDGNYEDEDPSIHFEEYDDDNYITIDDLNIIEQMNAAQINTNPETGETGNSDTDGVWRTIANHGYNLRPRPTRASNRYALVQNSQQSTEVKMAKPHAHVMMTQMSVKQGIKAFGECGSDAMLKELNQLHERKALLPLRKEDMSFEQRKKVLRYLMFLK